MTVNEMGPDTATRWALSFPGQTFFGRQRLRRAVFALRDKAEPSVIEGAAVTHLHQDGSAAIPFLLVSDRKTPEARNFRTRDE
jgi:hypothetical protein